MSKIFWENNFQNTLRFNGLDSFESLWNLNIGQVENPNRRRGGQGIVGRMTLEKPDGSHMAVFLKRQENDMARVLVPPFRIPSYERELHNIRRFEKMNIPVVMPLFFSKAKTGKNMRAILMTKALEGYHSLEFCLKKIENGEISSNQRDLLFSQTAFLVKQIHQKGFEHGALFGYHIFVAFDPTGRPVDIRFLDLEMARRHPGRVVRDLTRLYRRTAGWNEERYLLFLSCYLGKESSGTDRERLWQKIKDRIRSKT